MSLLGAATVSVATAGGGCSSTSTADRACGHGDRAGRGIPRRRLHDRVGAVRLRVGQREPAARRARRRCVGRLRRGVEHDQRALELGVDVLAHEVVDQHHDDARASASGPLFGNVTFCVDELGRAQAAAGRPRTRTRSRSSADASAAAMSAAAGLSAGFVEQRRHDRPTCRSLSASLGRPEPKVDSWPVQSMRLNQSPEL